LKLPDLKVRGARKEKQLTLEERSALRTNRRNREVKRRNNMGIGGSDTTKKIIAPARFSTADLG
jgi:uncharacterized protein with von Willebrand factor type A (vWA) domain